LENLRKLEEEAKLKGDTIPTDEMLIIQKEIEDRNNMINILKSKQF
jgi:hypothetical protein